MVSSRAGEDDDDGPAPGDEDYDSGASGGAALTPPDSPLAGGGRQQQQQEEEKQQQQQQPHLLHHLQQGRIDPEKDIYAIPSRLPSNSGSGSKEIYFLALVNNSIANGVHEKKKCVLVETLVMVLCPRPYPSAFVS